MRLPNGYGSIVLLSGNRRRPYMVRKTIGYDKNNRQVYPLANENQLADIQYTHWLSINCNHHLKK